MKLSLALVTTLSLGGLACSGSDERTISNPSPTDPAPSGNATSSGTATPPATPPATPATPPATPPGASAASVGSCASCTAGKCLTALQACAGAQACVDALVAFNSCFQKQTDGTSGTCGASFTAAGGPKAGALWSCDEASCRSECGVP